MRAISPHTRYSVQLIEGNEQIGLDSRGVMHSVVLSKPVIANFEHGGLMDHEIEAALEHFNFSGLPEGVNPLVKLAVFDTEAYGIAQHLDDETVEKMDERLREVARNHPDQLIVVDMPAAAKPWPTYDSDDADEIIAFQERLGINPETVRKYEEEHEGRSEVIEAMSEREAAAVGEEMIKVGV